MKNQDFAAIVATGLPVRFASQHGGRARIYLAGIFEEFMGNKSSARALAQKAENAQEDSHMGRAFSRLARRLNEARQSAAEGEAAVLAAMIPAGSKASTARI